MYLSEKMLQLLIAVFQHQQCCILLPFPAWWWWRSSSCYTLICSRMIDWYQWGWDEIWKCMKTNDPAQVPQTNNKFVKWAHWGVQTAVWFSAGAQPTHTLPHTCDLADERVSLKGSTSFLIRDSFESALWIASNTLSWIFSICCCCCCCCCVSLAISFYIPKQTERQTGRLTSV